MKKNVGTTDKTIRIVIGLFLIVLGIFSSKIWVIIGLFPLITGLLNYCPLYALLGISTAKEKTVK
jgi:hypothetical protein